MKSRSSARSGRRAAYPSPFSVRSWGWVARRARHPWRRPRHRAPNSQHTAARHTDLQHTEPGARQKRRGQPHADVLRSIATPALSLAAGGSLGAGPMLAVADLPTVIGNATNWLIGILAVLATFFLTLGGAKYLTAGGDPAEVEKAKTALKSAGIGYGLALMAPVILKILQQILGVGQP